ncbi:hypothetical protein [Rariglobus hedericola]|uniref:Uncharacterized protein n=1 Tax=Rariglobus hedericola TaxID=2597822 RepID=A0A556QK59_9BACT|nr:hypothetical protein [Rariglobus hedericola]TSJ77035.1 hypothetical protein FPL22_13065 [Rariglobus hedericola]
MKALPLVLVASLVANAALVTASLRQRSAAQEASLSPRASTASISTTARSTGPASSLKLSPELVESLNSGNSETLRDFLRAAGFSEDMVRSIVQMRIWKTYEARFKALNPQQNPDPNKPWWKEDRSQQNRWNGGMTKAQRDESRRLQREVRDETERLLGPDVNQNRWQDQRLSFLAPEKRQSLQDIQQDYQELMSEVQQDMQGFRLASDVEKLRFLQEEQKRDIEALMTPEERQDYDLRMSNTAQQLRWKMTQYDATEAEYLAIFPLQKAFDEKYNPRNNDPYGYSEQPPRDQNYWKERQAAEKQLQEQIKSMLGEQRYADSLRNQENDYQQLEAATRRLELPADTPTRLYALRDTASASVEQIAANTNLATDQKKEALAALASRTRDQVRSALGNEGAEAYFKNNGMGWLKELEKGNTITFRKDATGWETKALPKEPKKPATK